MMYPRYSGENKPKVTSIDQCLNRISFEIFLDTGAPSPCVARLALPAHLASLTIISSRALASFLEMLSWTEFSKAPSTLETYINPCQEFIPPVLPNYADGTTSSKALMELLKKTPEVSLEMNINLEDHTQVRLG